MSSFSEPLKRPGLTWRRMFALTLVLSAGFSVIIWSFRPGLGLQGFLWTFAACLVFSNMTGLPASYILTRWGPRTDQMAFPAKWVVIAGEILGFTIAGTFLAVILLRWIGAVSPDAFWSSFWTSVRISAVVALSVGMGVALWEFKKEELDEARREIQRRELAEARAMKLVAEARLSSLESRIHPHFLFNTLNSIASLIPDDPWLAEETVQRLASLLRFSLDANQERLVPLEQECRVVVDYLEIEKARFGERLRYSLDVDPAAGSALVPPLSLQTLVENSVKHAAATRRDGADIRVSARIEGGELELEVSDDGPGFTSADVKPGHGLDNLQERLAGLFGRKAPLDVRRNEAGRVCVRLRLPAEAART